MVIFDLGSGETLTLESGWLYSTIERDEDSLYSAAIDGMESLLLALYSAGIDCSTPAVREAVETAFEAIGNNYGDD
jgi:hypothetical protein